MAVLFALVAALFGVRTFSLPPLPLSLIASFDKAVAGVEQQIRELERAPASATRPQVAELLARLDGEITVACDAATEALDAVLAAPPSISAIHRAVVLACIDRHLWETDRDLADTIDPDVRVEYQATRERLVEIRALIT